MLAYVHSCQNLVDDDGACFTQIIIELVRAEVVDMMIHTSCDV